MWIAEHSVVLSIIIPDGILPCLLSDDEQVVGNGTVVDIAGGNLVRDFGVIFVGTVNGIVVASIVVVGRFGVIVCSSEFDMRIAAIVTDGFRTLSSVVMVLHRAKSPIYVDPLAPVFIAPVVGGMMTVGIVSPVLSKAAHTFTGQTGVVRNWKGCNRDRLHGKERLSNVDFVIHIHLTKAGVRLLASHSNADIFHVHVGSATSRVV